MNIEVKNSHGQRKNIVVQSFPALHLDEIEKDNRHITERIRTCSRLCLKSEALATYCGKQFFELWKTYLLLKK